MYWTIFITFFIYYVVMTTTVNNHRIPDDHHRIHVIQRIDNGTYNTTVKSYWNARKRVGLQQCEQHNHRWQWGGDNDIDRCKIWSDWRAQMAFPYNHKLHLYRISEINYNIIVNITPMTDGSLFTVIITSLTLVWDSFWDKTDNFLNSIYIINYNTYVVLFYFY